MSSSPLLALGADSAVAGIPQTDLGVPRPRFRWSTRVLVPAGILGGMAVALAAAAWSSLAPATAVAVELAVVKAVAAGNAGNEVVQAAGWVESDPYLIHVTSLTDGVVDSVDVLEGEAVTAGQAMARLVPDDARLAHERAQAQWRLRQAAAAEAQVGLDAAKAAWDNPVDRQLRVSAATALLQETTARKARLEAELQRQQILQEQTARTHRRLRDLGDAAVASVAEVEEAETALRGGEAAIRALHHALAEVAALAARHAAELHAATRHLELRIEERRDLEAAEAAVRRAEAEVEAAAVAAAEAALRVTRLEIKAPRDGIVVSRYKDPGDRVMLGGDSERAATLFSLYDPRSLQVRVDVPLIDAAKIALGQRCEIVCDVLPDRRFSGRVTRVLHAADIQKNTLQAKVALDDPAPELRPEMLARVRFLAAEGPVAEGTNAAVFVPADSLRDAHVWVVAGFDGRRGVAQSRAATAGRDSDGWIAVDSVHPGDVVIRSPAATLRPGRRVRLAIP